MRLRKFFKIIACVLIVEIIAIAASFVGENYSKLGFGKTSQNLGSVMPTIEQVSSGNSNQGEAEKTEDKKPVFQDVETVLEIELAGSYLDVYKKAVAGLGDSAVDMNRRLVAKIGLQILQSGVIKYENALHFYSLSYSSSGGTAGAVYYDLEDCIERINAGSRIYTDCFGFVRLTYSIACYTINSSNPASVSKMSELYGYKGAYTGSNITSTDLLSCGTVIYDRLTGTGSSTNRHVAMFLYEENGTVIYMDQSRVFSGEHQDGAYIYSAPGSRPYKFNTYKNYC